MVFRSLNRSLGTVLCSRAIPKGCWRGWGGRRGGRGAVWGRGAARGLCRG